MVVESPSVRFVEIARQVSSQARSLELIAPVFRSPPRIVGVSRTVRRRPDGQAVVAVLFKSRPWPAVVADLIEGVLVVNDLAGASASRMRDDLWQPFGESTELAA
jgi:hypothetical protein